MTEDNGSATGPEVPFEELDLEGKTRRNGERLARYQAQGLNMDPSLLRIGTMLEVLLGDRLPEAEELTQDRLAAMLDQVDAQKARAELLQPGAPPPARVG